MRLVVLQLYGIRRSRVDVQLLLSLGNVARQDDAPVVAVHAFAREANRRVLRPVAHHDPRIEESNSSHCIVAHWRRSHRRVSNAECRALRQHQGSGAAARAWPHGVERVSLRAGDRINPDIASDHRVQVWRVPAVRLFARGRRLARLEMQDFVAHRVETHRMRRSGQSTPRDSIRVPARHSSRVGIGCRSLRRSALLSLSRMSTEPADHQCGAENGAIVGSHPSNPAPHPTVTQHRWCRLLLFVASGPTTGQPATLLILDV